MPLIPAGPVVLGAIAAVLAIGTARAEGYAPGYRSGMPRHLSAQALPPETRYRDPRYRPPRRHAPRVGPPDFLIQAYLPRNTEAPIYNEPPSRFPRR